MSVFIWEAVSRNAPLCCEAEGFLNSGLSHQSSQLRMSKRSEGRLRAPWPQCVSSQFPRFINLCAQTPLWPRSSPDAGRRRRSVLID